MSNQNPEQNRQISIEEIDGRISEIERQRNEALQRSALLSGQLAVAEINVKYLQGELEKLKSGEKPKKGRSSKGSD